MEGDCAGKGAVALTLAARRAWPQRLELSVSFQGRGAVQCARAVPHFVALPRVHVFEFVGEISRVWCMSWSGGEQMVEGDN